MATATVPIASPISGPRLEPFDVDPKAIADEAGEPIGVTNAPSVSTGVAVGEAEGFGVADVPGFGVVCETGAVVGVVVRWGAGVAVFGGKVFTAVGAGVDAALTTTVPHMLQAPDGAPWIWQ